MSSPAIRDGAIIFQSGKIKEIGNAKDLVSRNPDAIVLDLERSSLLPGLINAHTHLELSLIKKPAQIPAGGFVGWIQNVMSQAPSEMTVHTAVKHGAQQCLQFGVTTVGDISRQCDLTRPVLKNTKLRAVSFGEVQAMAQRRQFLEAGTGRH